MLEFIQFVYDFLANIVSGTAQLIEFIPKALTYVQGYIDLLPAFMLPCLGILIPVVIFNRVTS